MSGGVLVNAGSGGFWSGDATININGGTTSAISNAVGGTFDLQGDGLMNVNGGAGAFNNAGTLLRTTSSGTVSFGSGIALNNSGTVRAQTGNVSFNGGYTQTAGVLELAGGNVGSSSALQIQGGLVNGFGNINAALMNNAMLRPDLGTGGLHVTGNVSLLGSSNLVFQIGGLAQGTQYGFLNVTGNVSLGGNLVVSFVNSFVAQNGDSFTVLNSTAPLSGTFANVASGGRLTESGTGGSFLVNYSGNTIIFSDFQGGPVPALPASATSGGAVQIGGPTAVNRAGPQPRNLAVEVAPDSPATARGTVLMARRAGGSSPPQRVRAQGIAMQNSDQALELLEGEDATVGGKVMVKARRAAKAASRQGRAIPQGATARGDAIPNRRGDQLSGSVSGRASVVRSAAPGRATD